MSKPKFKWSNPSSAVFMGHEYVMDTESHSPKGKTPRGKKGADESASQGGMDYYIEEDVEGVIYCIGRHQDGEGSQRKFRLSSAEHKIKKRKLGDVRHDRFEMYVKKAYQYLYGRGKA